MSVHFEKKNSLQGPALLYTFSVDTIIIRHIRLFVTLLRGCGLFEAGGLLKHVRCTPDVDY